MMMLKNFRSLLSLALLIMVFVYCESPTKPERDAPLDEKGINYQVPESPLVIDPDINAGFGELYIITWTKTDRANQYIIEESTDSLFVTTVIDTVAETSCNYRHYVDALTTYYYRAQGINGEYKGNWSNTVDISVNPLEAPQITSQQSTVLSDIEYSLTWATVDSAQTYRIQESTNTTFSNPLEITSDIPSYKTNHTTESSTTYYYRVKALHNDNTSVWSNVVEITVTPPLPATPVLEAPVVHWNSVTLNWNSVNYATSYTIEESDNNSFTDAQSYELGNTTSYVFSYDVNETKTFFYRVKAEGISGSGDWSNKIECIVSPFELVLTISENEVFSEEDYSLSWNDVIATSYVIEEASNSNFSNAMSIACDGTIKSFNYDKVNQQTLYYRVQALDGSNTSDWSNVVTVVITPPVPNIPVLDEATVNGNQVTLNWSDVKYATSYRLEADTDSSFSNAVFEETDTPSHIFSYNLDSTSTYYYRVKSLGASGSSGWSNVVHVTIEPVTHELTVEIHPSGSGSTEPPVGSHIYNENTVVTIRAIPSQGYRFVSWTGNVADATSAQTTVTVTADMKVMANFEAIPEQFTLTMAVNEEGFGTTTPEVGSHTCDEDSVVTITATPATGYQFVNWTGTVADETSAETTVAVTGNMTVTANFEVIPITPIELTMVSIPAGSFLMGSNDGEDNEQPIHKVTLDAFEMSATEITNSQYCMFLNEALNDGIINATEYYVEGMAYDAASLSEKIMKYIYLSGADGSYNKCWIDFENGVFKVESGKEKWPVVFVSFHGARAFAEYYGYDLPTEAEWEYAARGGQQLKCPTDDGTIDYTKANYNKRIGHPTDVGTYPPNPFGLYNMSGNVEEWCLDEFFDDFYSRSPEDNPISTQNIGSRPISRGSEYFHPEYYCRSAYRGMGNNPSVSSAGIGFRVVRRSGRTVFERGSIDIDIPWPE